MSKYYVMISKIVNNITVHLWCDDHSTSINICKSVEVKDWGSSLHEKVSHIYTLKLD